MTIIGIGHKKRRGKDTAADALVRDLGYVKVGFADKLKALAYAANPMVLAESPYVNVQVGHNRLASLVDRYGYEYVKDHYPPARQFLQDLGQAGRQVFGEDFWFGEWAASVVDMENVVVPDVRFRNEAARLRELGAALVRIDRVVPGASDSDVSEHDLDDWDDWDLEIRNSGTIVDLQRTIVDWAKNLIPPPTGFDAFLRPTEGVAPLGRNELMVNMEAGA